jgi:di/tricarboxylate transporter
LFAGLWFAFKLRKRDDITEQKPSKFEFLRALVHRPEQFFFFLPLGLIVALLAVEMRRGLITFSWSVLGVLVFLFALWVGERSFRLAGLGLLLLGVGKIIVVDVWELNPRDRYLTFISMGSALLLVSFLYTRYREAIRRYL